jgi:hypothetical protein
MGGADPLPILVELPERAKQRRWTVLIRGILAIPLGVVVVAVAIAAGVCAVIGWFAALFTGRAPDFLRTIVTLLIRLQLRLESYLLLLTDRFPPFSTEEVPDYGVALAVPPATPLNRVAVLFRIILVIPANILVSLAQYGIALLSIVGWFAALFTGWLPRPFHDAYRAFIRYQARVTGYFLLLVPTYPAAFFGEEAGPETVWAPAPVPSAPGVPVSEVTGPAPSRDPWRLVLSQGARTVLIVAVVLGIPLAIGNQVLTRHFGSSSHSDHQALVQANNQLVGDFNQYASTAKGCTSVPCIEHADQVLAQQLGAFVSVTQNAGNSGVNADVVSQMTQAASTAQQAMSAVADGGPTLAGYRAVAQRVHVARALDDLAQAQTRFSTALNNS